MKTATELFNKHFRGTDYEGQFEEALAEHDKEIIELIESHRIIQSVPMEVKTIQMKINSVLYDIIKELEEK